MTSLSVFPVKFVKPIMKNIVVAAFILIFISTTSCKKDLVDTSANQIEDVTDLQSFKSQISSGVSLVFFHASWCKICKEQRPHFESASENSDLNFVLFLEVEYDDNPEICDEYDVPGFPQTLVFKDGVEQTRVKGSGHTEQELKDLLLAYK